MKTVKESILDYIEYLKTVKKSYRGKFYSLKDTDQFPTDIRFIYPSFVKVKDPFRKKYPKETLDILQAILYNTGKGISVKAFELAILETDDFSDVWSIAEKAFEYSQEYKIVKRVNDTSFYEKLKEK